MKPLIRGSLGELQDLVEVGAVGEDLRRDRVEHAQRASLVDDVDGPSDVSHAVVGRPVARVGDGVDRGFSTRIVRHPAPRPASASTSESPIIQLRGEVDVERRGGLEQHARLRLAAVAGPREAGVDRIGVVQAVAVVVDHDALARQAAERRARGPRGDPRAKPCPWPRLAGSRQRRHGSRASGYDGSRRPLPGRAGRPPRQWGLRTTRRRRPRRARR